MSQKTEPEYLEESCKNSISPLAVLVILIQINPNLAIDNITAFCCVKYCLRTMWISAVWFCFCFVFCSFVLFLFFHVIMDEQNNRSSSCINALNKSSWDTSCLLGLSTDFLWGSEQLIWVICIYEIRFWNVDDVPFSHKGLMGLSPHILFWGWHA